MGLIPRIDNAALIGGGARDLLTDMLCPLLHVKDRATSGAKHLSSSSEDLARDQERDQLFGHIVEV